MASNTHVNNTVNERRLRPIYDWLDTGNNKKVLQEADKVLKKQPNNQCAKVLKALALLRLGKENECQVIMDKVRSEVPCESSTLQVMSIYYRESHQPDKISEIYEAAAKAAPNNEELLTNLFMSYVLLGDYKKQQQTALALYKLKQKNYYYFWAVTSLIMQALHGDKKLARGVTLPLAERMVLKLIKEEKIEAEQEVQLYLIILQLQGKNDEMLNVLCGPLASHITSLPQRKAQHLLELEWFPEAANAYEELITKDTDNWQYYQNYLTAALKYQKPEGCLDFFNEIISMSDKKVRAPHLAKFELLKRTRKEEIFENNLKPVDLIHQYFAQFGEKGCVVEDLRLYLNLLTPENRIELLQKIEEDVGVKPDGFPTSIQQMQRHIHLEQLRRICGFHQPPKAGINEQKQLVQRFCKLYEKGNELYPVQERPFTDFGPADSYIHLAAHLLHQLWRNTDDVSHLYRAIALLEGALLSSPVNFHIKILLIRMYLEAGLVDAADLMFTALDVKHIQLDSLGYLHTLLLAPMGHFSLASTTLEHCTKFFIADNADHLTLAYKRGNFMKINDFMELKKRLENSFHFVMTTIDNILLQLCWRDSADSLFSTLSNIHIQPAEDSIRLNSLRDNRDLQVVCGWEPLTKDDEDPRMQEETRTCMLRLLVARNSVLKILAACATPDCYSLLKKLSGDLKQLESEHIPSILQKFEFEGRRDIPCNILVPMDAVERLREAHYSEQLKTIAQFAESVSESRSPDFECIEMLRNSTCLQPLDIPEEDTPVSFKRFLLRASTCSESLAIIGAICAMCVTHMHPQSAQKKKNKKCVKPIESIVPENDNDNKWRDVAVLLEEKIHNLDAVLTEFEKYQLYTGLENNEDEVCATIKKHGQTSLNKCCRSLKSRAEVTLKLLNSFKS